MVDGRLLWQFGVMSFPGFACLFRLKMCVVHRTDVRAPRKRHGADPTARPGKGAVIVIWVLLVEVQETPYFSKIKETP